MGIRPSRLVLAAMASCGPLCAFGEELWERPWLELRTPHFVIASALSEKRSRELAVDLENFRVATETLTNIGRYQERIPTKIYLVPDGESDFGVNRVRAGYFRPGMRSNVAVMRPDGDHAAEVLKHEYVHFLVHNRDTRLYPTWYNEGLAEVFATVRVEGNSMEWGRPTWGHLAALRARAWMPFEDLLGVRETSSLDEGQRGMFYAQSWLLTHYVLYGRSDARVSHEVERFLTLSEAGQPPVQALEDAFGVPLRRLRTTLGRYLEKLRWPRATSKKPFPQVDPAVRRLARDEIGAELGWLAFHARGHEKARPYFDAALAANPHNCDALVGLADVHKLSNRFAEAKPLYEKAIALHPDGADHELDFAEYFLTLAGKEKEPEAIRAHLVEARRHFARSHALNPHNPETLAMNGRTYLYPGQDAEKALESLEAAHRLLPSHRRIRFLLAKAYVANGQRDKARSHARALRVWSHSDAIEGVEQLLREIEAPSGEKPASGEEAGAPK